MIYHLALETDWDAARRAGEYRVSTLGVTLEQEGFIHTSFADQVPGTAERYYADVTEPLVLLHVDETRLTTPWQVDAVPGAREGFPHVYGPITVDAVVAVTPVTRNADGTWTGLPAWAAPAGHSRPAGDPRPVGDPRPGRYLPSGAYLGSQGSSSACSGVGESPNRR